MLEVVQETKLVGVIVSQDLKWGKNTDFICTRARRKLLVLRRLRKFNIEIPKLLGVYKKKEIRSLLEYAVPVWYSSIAVKQSNHQLKEYKRKPLELYWAITT